MDQRQRNASSELICNALSQHITKLIAQVKIKGHNGNEVKLMAVRQRRYSKEEMARRGQELYESDIRQQVEVGNEGKIVAIDIETGEFEVDENVVPATNRLFERYPDAQPWVIRIGHRAVDHFGARSLKKNQ
jgi:hypothetical protein